MVVLYWSIPLANYMVAVVSVRSSVTSEHGATIRRDEKEGPRAEWINNKETLVRETTPSWCYPSLACSADDICGILLRYSWVGYVLCVRLIRTDC